MLKKPKENKKEDYLKHEVDWRHAKRKVKEKDKRRNLEEIQAEFCLELHWLKT